MMQALFTPSPWALAVAFAIDALLGEPPARVHPVVWIGRLADVCLRRAPAAGPLRQFAFGLLIALLVPGAAAAAACGALAACGEGPARLAVEALLLSSLFAVRALGEAALGVGTLLDEARLADARAALANLCSRDAADLAPHELAAAAIESTAENTSDSIVAPFFWYALLGLPGAALYRAVNTLDAMIGYHGRFEYLGKAAARLDDALNFVPARVTAGLVLLAGALERGRLRHGLRVWRRDARKTESPNAGHPMAAMAGLLGLQLAKRGAYTLGDAARAAAPADVGRAWRIASRAAWIALVIAVGATLERRHG